MNTFYSQIQNTLIEAGFIIKKDIATNMWLLLDSNKDGNDNVLMSARQLGELLNMAEKEMGL